MRGPWDVYMPRVTRVTMRNAVCRPRRGHLEEPAMTPRSWTSSCQEMPAVYPPLCGILFQPPKLAMPPGPQPRLASVVDSGVGTYQGPVLWTLFSAQGPQRLCSAAGCCLQATMPCRGSVSLLKAWLSCSGSRQRYHSPQLQNQSQPVCSIPPLPSPWL